MKLTTKKFEEAAKKLKVNLFTHEELTGFKLNNGKTVYFFTKSKDEVVLDHSFNMKSEQERKGTKYSEEVKNYLLEKLS